MLAQTGFLAALSVGVAVQTIERIRGGAARGRREGVIRRIWGSGAERQVVDKRASVSLPIVMAGLNLNQNELRRIFFARWE